MFLPIIHFVKPGIAQVSRYHRLYSFTSIFKRCITSQKNFSIQLSEKKSSPYLNRTNTFLFCRKERFSTERPNNENTSSDEAPQENPVSLRNRLLVATLFVSLVGIGYYFAERNKNTKSLKKREESLTKVDIGAKDYELTDHTGKRVSKKDFLDKWLLLYFGFTHCPDICPEELERMSEVVTEIDNDKSIPDIQPIFVSVDPERDTPEAMTSYLSDFHSKFIGLTGSVDEVKHATKVFRVYYQAGPKDSDNDYIVDHTIVMYLINPKGNFVDYYGSRSTPMEKIVTGIKNNMKNYARLHG